MRSIECRNQKDNLPIYETLGVQKVAPLALVKSSTQNSAFTAKGELET
jgi:hypothetical protein